MTGLPVLYSFRRCPYAMRARLAIAVSGVQTELREVVLRDKPSSMVAASPKSTVPVLVLREGAVLEESLDIMFWALEQQDPEEWLHSWHHHRTDVEKLLSLADGPFKDNLDRYKYPGRYPDEKVDPAAKRTANLEILRDWDQQLANTGWLFGDTCTVADMAVLPFVRQYAHVDKAWFDEQDIPHVRKWLEAFLTSDLFLSTMTKYDQWQEGEPGIRFPS